MDVPYEVKRARMATLLMFLICGVSVSCWAPMVPLAKQRIGLSDKELGAILLAMGAGAIITMPFVGPLIQKNGSRKIVVCSSILAAITLPVLTIVDTAFALGATLFVFGASLGSLDVSMNAQAVVVETAIKRPVMSSFHGMFSVGGLTGSLLFGGLLFISLTPLLAAISIGVILLSIVAINYRYFLDHPPREEEEKFAFRLPKGPVLILGLFCFIVFLVEGAMLDWSAVFLHEHRNFGMAAAGAGYSVFSIAMALMRFTGDKLVLRAGANKTVFVGASLAAAGLLLAVLLPWQATILLGFLLVGIGAANIVPVLFSAAGKADPRSPELALAAVTTMGYAGQLAGPALIGFAADYFSLPMALGLLAAPLLIVALSFGQQKSRSVSSS